MVEKDRKKEDRLLTVGEAATMLNVTAATLRNWDRAGKLKSRRHPINSYRLYSEADIQALKKAIRGGKT
jgi:excisionase family DNA binding protein